MRTVVTPTAPGVTTHPTTYTTHLVELKRLLVMVTSWPRYPTAAARVANSVTPLRRDAGHTACRNDNHSYLGCSYEIFHAMQTASHPGRCERRQRANVAQSCNTPNVVERGCRVANHPGRCERRQRANVALSCNTPNVVERGLQSCVRM